MISQDAHNQGGYQPFPVDCLPEPLAGFVKFYSKSIGCDPVMVALPGLAVYGAAVGNSVRVVVPGKEDWKTPCVIWSMIVGESGDHKSPALDYVVKPVIDLGFAAKAEYSERLREYSRRKMIFEKAKSEWEKGKESGPPPEMPEEPTQVRRMVDDATVEATAGLFLTNPRSLLLARDELGDWPTSFNQYKKGKCDAGQWLTMYGARSITVDRKSGDPKTIMIRNAYLCVTGGIQPGKLVRTMTPELREQGMLGRFLLAYPPPTDDMWTSVSIPAGVSESYANSVGAIYDFPLKDNGQFTELTTSPEATALYISFYNRNRLEAKGMCGDLRAAILKLEEIPRRLAGIIHMIKWATGVDSNRPQETIGEETMRSAITLTEWFKNETKRIYAELFIGKAEVRGKTAKLSPEQKLVEFITERAMDGQISVPTVYQCGPTHVRSAKNAREALQALVDKGIGEWSGDFDFTGEKDYFRLIPETCITSQYDECCRATHEHSISELAD